MPKKITMLKWIQQSLSREIAFYTLLGLCAAFFIFCLVFLPLFKKNMEKDLISHLKATEESLQVNGRYPLYTFSNEMLKDLVSAVKIDSEIAFAEIYDSNNELQGAYYAADLDEDSKNNPEQSKRIFYSKTKIYYGDTWVGSMKLGVSKKRIDKNVTEFWKVIGMVVLLTGFTFSLIVFLYLERGVRVPMAELEKASRYLSSGLIRQVELPDNLSQDWYRVAETFNKMTDSLLKQDELIRDYTHNLEKAIEQRTQELDDQRAKSMTSAKMAALGEMSAGMAHEINNPLTILLGHAHAIRAKLEKSPEHLFAVDSSIKSIENTVRRISKIIKGLRTFARDAANDPFRPAAVYRIVEDTLSLCHNRAHNLGIEVKIENEISDLEIDCREVQISQVLLNLLNNAIDAISNQEDKWIRVKISQIEENYLQIQVEDSGHGIPKEIRDKMMQPFFTTKEVGKGTGLGLSIVKGIIESHSGQFKYNESSANTCFQIVLPIYQLSNEEIMKNAA